LTDLAELLTRDLSTVDTEELVAGIRDAEATRDRATEWSGRLIAELHRHTKLVAGGPQSDRPDARHGRPPGRALPRVAPAAAAPSGGT
jgi:hypothetical protein